MTRIADGQAAEALAAGYLEKQGLRLLERNYRSVHGEIDLVYRENSTLVFVEVRYRARSDYGTPAETVDSRKQARLRATAEHYLLTHRGSKSNGRFDIVAISGDLTAATIEWLKNVF